MSILIDQHAKVFCPGCAGKNGIRVNTADHAAQTIVAAVREA